MANRYKLAAVGHRVVHGAERLIAPTRIDNTVEKVIDECSVFAPLPSTCGPISRASS